MTVAKCPFYQRSEYNDDDVPLLRIWIVARGTGKMPLRNAPILGDPGAVSRVGRKGGTRVFKYGQKSPWVPTLTELFPKIQADAGS